jgi:uncharacterized membrane protein
MKMFWPIIVVTVGLVLTLAGMIISFRFDPPDPKPLPLEEHAKWQMKFLLAFNRGKILKPFLTTTEWTLVGFSLLKLGTVLQLIGTVWQVTRLA